MQDRTIRFLNSIGINNVDDYDLDFDVITKSKYFRDRFIFSVKKKTPWEFKKLDAFLNGLRNITSYTYEFNFVYETKPDNESLFQLINEWYFNREFKDIPAQKVEIDGSEFSLFVFEEGKEEFTNSLTKDLEMFLSFISYPCKLKIEKAIPEEDKMPWEEDNNSNEPEKKEEIKVYTKEVIESNQSRC